ADSHRRRERRGVPHHFDTEIHQAAEVLGMTLGPLDGGADAGLEPLARGVAAGLRHLRGRPVARDGREGEANDLLFRREVVREVPAREAGLLLQGADGAGTNAVASDDLDRGGDDVAAAVAWTTSDAGPGHGCVHITHFRPRIPLYS